MDNKDNFVVIRDDDKVRQLKDCGAIFVSEYQNNGTHEYIFVYDPVLFESFNFASNELLIVDNFCFG